MARVFVDVGGYHGDSSLAALDPAFAFDRVFCFEPVARCVAVITRRVRDARLAVVQACLSDRSGPVTIFNPGTLGASVYADAPAEGTAAPETAVAIDASSFFRSFVRPTDDVWMKLNCEGSECAVLESVLSGGSCAVIRNVLVDFDAGKIPSQRHRVAAVRQRLLDEHVPFSLPEEVQYGMINNYGAIRNWLLVTGAGAPGASRRVRSLIYNCGVVVGHPECSGYHKKKVLDALPFLSAFARSRRRGRVAR
jgi:FkbM family methyltransferase